MVVGDNIKPDRSFVSLTFDGTWPHAESGSIWEHFVVRGPSPEFAQPAVEAARD
jgi:hypothetical protein